MLGAAVFSAVTQETPLALAQIALSHAGIGHHDSGPAGDCNKSAGIPLRDSEIASVR